MTTIVMYHFVNDSGRNHAFTTSRFRNQVQSLARQHEFLSPYDYLAGADTSRACLFTFDDGLKDGIEHAAPILEECGARGIFYVPTCILEDEKLLAAHKRTMLLSQLGLDAVLDAYNAAMPEWYRVGEGQKLDAYNDPRTSELKFLLDHMEVERANGFIDDLFRRHFDEREEFSRLYLSVADMKNLRERGHFVGSHGHAHRWLGKLYPQDQLADLQRSVQLFHECLGEHPRMMSYPFGSQNSITGRLLGHLGFDAAMLDPTSAVSKETRFEINRVDCIDVTENGPPSPSARVSMIH